MISVQKPKGKQSNKKSRLKPGAAAVLKVLLIIFLAVTLIFIAARAIGGVTLTSVVSDIKTSVSSLGSGDGYPYKTDGAEVVKAYNDSSKLFLFSNDKTVLLSSSAKVLSEIPVEYGAPAVKYNSGKALVYDRDSGKYRLQNTSEIITQKEAENTITAGTVGKKGNYALATYGSGIQSVFSVFDKSDEQVFTWNFAAERVTDISLSDDGKYAAVGTILSSNAQTDSKVYVFRFDSKDYVSCIDYPDSIVVSVSYVSGNDIEVVTNKQRSFIADNTAKEQDDVFGSDVLHRKSEPGSKISAVALKKYGSDSKSVVKAYKGSKLLFSADIDNEIRSVSCSDKYVAVLSDKKVLIYNKKGDVKAEIPADISVNSIVINGKKVYLISSAEITCEKF